LITVAAWVLAGVALWLSRSVLDMFGDASHSTRVAMLPSIPELAGLIMLALLLAAAVAGLVRRWSGNPAERSDARLQIALPLFALSLLTLPYLPILPDVIRPLRAFAGPIVWLIWIVVAGLVSMTALAVRRSLLQRRRSIGGTRLVGTVLIFFLTCAAGGVAGLRLRDSLTYPSGDEPRYMAMMQRLWQDHDHAIDAPLVGGSQTIYSAVPVGIAVLGAPVLAWRGYHGLIWMFVLITACCATLMWRWAFAYSGSGEAATVAWAAVFLGAPMLFSSIAIYPDVPAALCVLVAIAWRSTPQRTHTKVAEYVVRGLALSALPWLSMTYSPMAAAIVVLLGLRGAHNRRAVAALLALFTVSMISSLAFLHAVSGRWSPMTGGGQPVVGNPLVGMLGLLFDHEYGVLPYAPALVIGIVGLFRMAIAHDALTRARGRELAISFAVLLASVGALMVWWGGGAPPGRPLVPALPLLGMPIAWAYQRASDSPTRRALYQVLLFIGVALALLMLFGESGDLIAQDRDGSSRVLQWLTSLWPAWEAAPAVAAFGIRQAWPLIALWLFAGAAVWWVANRVRIQSSGVGALAASLYVATAAILVAVLGPLVATPASAWVLQPESRSRVPLLDSFDSTARPHAIVYNRLTVTRAESIPRLMTLAAAPGERPGEQPVRVLLNARYALAAGEYEVAIGGVPGDQPVHGNVALQLGRLGSPVIEWDVTIPPGGTWRQRFSLPVDIEFVGFVTPPPLDHATSLRITPISIVDSNRRQANVHGLKFVVLGAVAFPTVSLFFHDEGVYPERTGIWVHGDATTLMTVAPARPEQGITLRVHSGARSNIVTFSTTTWGERVELPPGSPREVHIPPPPKPGPFLLRVKTDNSFIPADVVPGSPDRRILGCWVEVLP
jgi:hypothetical protein